MSKAKPQTEIEQARAEIARLRLLLKSVVKENERLKLREELDRQQIRPVA